MNLYTIVTNDKYELPVLCDLNVKEAAEFMGTTGNNLRNMVLKPRKKARYKVIITGKVKSDKAAYQKMYDMTHDRSEYFKQYYRRKVRNGKESIQRIQAQQQV